MSSRGKLLGSTGRRKEKKTKKKCEAPMAALGVAPLIFVNNHALHLDSMTELYFYFLYEWKGVK